MIISNLKLENYRNIKKINLEFNNNFNVIYGENAQGKTNLIEAIYLIANLKSFRSSNNCELIKNNTDTSYINAKIITSEVSRNIDLYLNKKTKIIKIDNKKPESINDCFGHFRPILFFPEEVSIISGIPTGRRSLLDRAVFQSNPLFLNLIKKYNRILKHRNKLLKNGQKLSIDDPWTEALVKTGTSVRIERKNYLNRLIPLFKIVFSNFTEGAESAHIDYILPSDQENVLKDTFRSQLIETAERENILGQTLVGPHRDDPQFFINGKSAKQYASQGQLRSLILAFKTAQVLDLENLLGTPPVLLLDDMTGDLDPNRQKFFYDFLKKRSGQIFLTTTDLRPLVKAGITTGRYFLVKQGQIRDIAENEEFYE